MPHQSADAAASRTLQPAQHPRWIKKRNGVLQQFDLHKLERALLMALKEATPAAIPDVRPLAQDAISRVTVTNQVAEIERVQDGVEMALMCADHHEAARAYIRYRQQRTDKRAMRLKPDNMAMADYTFQAKYAAHLPEEQRREVYEETVTRTKLMHLTKFPEFAKDIEDAFAYVYRREVLPAMRVLQFAGTPVEKHNARSFNCSWTLLDRPRAFQEAFYLLLCGCGVGYSVRFEHIAKLPSIKRPDESKVLHHHLEDSIEGWANALGALVNSYFEGTSYVEFNYSPIRQKGAPISSGGKAPGHIVLKRALEQIRALLQNAVGRELRPIEAHDIVCYEAEAVLSGGVRRSSLISIFSPDDGEMMRAKAKENFRPAFGDDPGLNSHRQMANNSVALTRDQSSLNAFTRAIQIAEQNYCDPGFVFAEQSHYGCNPCAEIFLNPLVTVGDVRELVDSTWAPLASVDQVMTGYSFCNLCEINLARITDQEHFVQAARAAALIGTLQATYTSFPYLGPVTEAVARREALLGVSLTGMADNPTIAFEPAFQRQAAEAAVATNQHWAPRLGIRPAARICCVKPSGTASVILGVVGSGIHPHHARRYFRRITANPLETVAQHFKRINPHMVEQKPNGDWSLVFPIEAPEDAVTVKEEAALEFLKRVISTYENWILPGTARPDSSPGLTHNISATVAFRPEEHAELIRTIWENRHSLAALSFVPMSIDKGFAFVPREEVTTAEDEARWNRLIAGYKKIDWSQFREVADNTSLTAELACSGGACEIG